MKTITAVVPTYNEESNVKLIHDKLCYEFLHYSRRIKYKILFIDNYSKDNTRRIIKELAKKNKNVQYIFNNKNYGFSRSLFYGLTQVKTDAAILIFADMQDPPSVIPMFLNEYFKGHGVVIGIKNDSKENKVVFFLRKMYYKFINAVTDIEHIEQFDGFGLYDKKTIEIFRKLDDPLPYFRGIVAELANEPKRVLYTQEKRKRGKSAFNIMKLYELAMLGITSYSRTLVRLFMIFGVFVSVISIIIAIVSLILKLFNIITYPIGNAALIFGIFFIGGVQLMFIGIIGEYVLNINTRTMKRPLVIEEERGNI